MKLDFFAKLKEVFNTPEAAAKFADAKTDKGDILKISPAIEAGATVEIVSEDGTTSSAPSGKHKLEDGTEITVDQNGVITDVTEKVEEQSKETELATDETKLEEAPVEAGSDLEGRIGQIEEAVGMILEWIKGQNGEMAAAKDAEAKLAKENEEKAKAELAVKDAELSKVKIELRKIKAAPSLNFKATAPVENKNLVKAPVSDMQKRLQALRPE